MNIQQMMKQAQAMQQRMQDMQEKLADVEVTGTAGGDAVTVVMTCKGELRNIAISPSVINPDDKETLEDLVMVAVNAARRNADQRMADETGKMMTEFGMPANVKLPF